MEKAARVSSHQEVAGNGLGYIDPEEYMSESRFMSPSVHIDALVFFLDTMGALAAATPGPYGELTARLGEARPLFDTFLKEGKTSKDNGGIGELYGVVPELPSDDEEEEDYD